MWFESAHVELVRDAFPEWMAFCFAALSYLGSVWVVAPAVVLSYWVGDRHRFAPWLGIVAGCYAVMHALKGLFATPRPGVGPAITPDSLPTVVALLYAPAVEVGTTSFPSGHTLAATVLWTMVALEFDGGTRRRDRTGSSPQPDSVRRHRLIAAGIVVVLVAFARVAVGLHFPIDVIAGALVGVCYLALLLTIRNRVRRRNDRGATSAMFAIGAVFALAAAWITGRPLSMALVGGCAGGLLAWRYATPPRTPSPLTLRSIAHAGLGTAVLALVALVALLVDTGLGWVAVGFIGGVLVVGLPGLLEQRRGEPGPANVAT